MNTDKMARDTITTIVEPISSSLVDHDTLAISSLTSLKKPKILFATTIFTYRFLCLTPYLYILIVYQYGIKVAGAGGIEPPVTVLETVGLPLTDAPKTRTPAKTAGLIYPYFISLCGVCFLQNLQNLLRCSLSGFCFLFFVEQ